MHDLIQTYYNVIGELRRNSVGVYTSSKVGKSFSYFSLPVTSRITDPIT